METLDEDVLGKAYDAKLMRWYLGFLRPHRRMVLWTSLLVLLGIGGELVGPFLLEGAINGPVKRGDSAGLLVWVAGFGVSILGIAVIEFLSTFIANITGQRIILDIRSQVFRHLQRLPVGFFDRNPVGRLVVRVTNDVENLNELFTSGLVSFFADILIVLGIVGAMFYFSAGLTLVSMSMAPVLAAIVLLFRKFAREKYREIRRRIAQLNAYLAESIQGMRIIKMFTKQEFVGEKFGKLGEDYCRETIGSVFLYSAFLPAIELCSSLLTGILVWTVAEVKIEFGTFLAFWYCLAKIFHPLRDLSEKYNILQAAMASSERLKKILDSVPESNPNNGAGSSSRGEIEFRDVTFSYDGRRNVLENVSFRVRPGEKVAIVGFTGAGKTTLVNLLLRFYEPTRGDILLDGRPLAAYDLQALRQTFGWVGQDVFLFSGTVAENIRLSRDVAPEQVEAWGRMVHVDRLMDRLALGYRTDVRERGVAVSAGERQLISLARAMSFDPRIVLLDEATSYVDMETERLVHDAASKLMQGRTALVIAHRLATVRDADRILVLHRGRVAEVGTHEELVARRGIYEKLCRLQFDNAGAAA